MFVNTTPDADLTTVTLVTDGVIATVTFAPREGRAHDRANRHADLQCRQLQNHLDAVGEWADHKRADGAWVVKTEAFAAEEWATTTAAHVVRVQR